MLLAWIAPGFPRSPDLLRKCANGANLKVTLRPPAKQCACIRSRTLSPGSVRPGPRSNTLQGYRNLASAAESPRSCIRPVHPTSGSTSSRLTSVRSATGSRRGCRTTPTAHFYAPGVSGTGSSRSRATKCCPKPDGRGTETEAAADRAAVNRPRTQPSSCSAQPRSRIHTRRSSKRWPERDEALQATFSVTGVRLAEAIGLNLLDHRAAGRPPAAGEPMTKLTSSSRTAVSTSYQGIFSTLLFMTDWRADPRAR